MSTSIAFSIVKFLKDQYDEEKASLIGQYSGNTVTACIQNACRKIIENNLYPFFPTIYQERTFDNLDIFCKDIYSINESKEYIFYNKIKNENKEKFKAELWYGVYNGSPHVEVIFYNEYFTLDLHFDDKKNYIKNDFFQPLFCISLLSKPFVIFENELENCLIDKKGYSKIMCNFFSENLIDKFKAKILKKKFIIPFMGNYLEDWYQTLFPHLGFLNAPSKSLVEDLSNMNSGFINLLNDFHRRQSFDFWNTIDITLHMSDDEIWNHTYLYYSDLNYRSSIVDKNEENVVNSLTNLINDDKFMSEVYPRYCQQQVALAMLNLNTNWQQVYVTNNNNLKTLKNVVNLINPKSFFKIIPTFDNHTIENIIRLVGVKSEIAKPKNMSWRDFNANLMVYNNKIASVLDLHKVHVNYFKVDNNLKKRYENILSMLPDFDIYSISEIRDYYESYLQMDPYLPPLIVENEDFEESIGSSLLENDKKVIECLVTSGRQDDSDSEEEELKHPIYDSPVLDEIKILPNNKLSVGREIYDKVEDILVHKRKIFETVKPKHKVMKGKRAYKPACGVEMGEVCGFTEDPDNFNKRYFASKTNMNKSLSIAKSEKFFSEKVQDFFKNKVVKCNFKIKNGNLNAIEDVSNSIDIPKKFYRILVDETDYSKFVKKGFSKKEFTKLLKKEMHGIAQTQLLALKLDDLYYDVAKMEFKSHSVDISASQLNQEFYMKVRDKMFQILGEWDDKLKLEGEAIELNVSKLMNSIKYYHIKAFRKLNQRVRNKNDKLTIALMKMEEYQSIVDKIRVQGYLNKKDINITKSMRRNLINLLLDRHTYFIRNNDEISVLE